MRPAYLKHNEIEEQIHGEDALAFGALAAGVSMVTSYPGSPGIGTVNAIVQYAREHAHPYVEWSVNERVALEMGIGASMAGRRSLVCCKSVGMNVMLDTLMTLNLTGVHGGLVILLGDDPGAYGSQNEQDTRALAAMVEIPMLEPAAPGEACHMMRAAFELSEHYRSAIVLRITRSFSQMVGTLPEKLVDEVIEPVGSLGLSREAYRFVPYPANAVEMHRQNHARLRAFEDWAETTRYNHIQGDGAYGVLAAGVVYSKLMDVIGGQFDKRMRVFKVSCVYPLPRRLTQKFLDGCDQVLVLEEPDPVIETALKAQAHDLDNQVAILGRTSGHLPVGDELLGWQIQFALEKILPGFVPAQAYLSENAPLERSRKENHCAASPNKQILALLQEAAEEIGVHPVLIGDPGCWVQVAGQLDGKFAIGSAVAVASGLVKAGVKERVVALFGDSAFFHSALPAICNAAYNGSSLFMLLLDNGGAISTGAQPTPASGVDAFNAPALKLSIPEIARACGVSNLNCLPSTASKHEIKQALRAGLQAEGLVLLVLQVEPLPVS